MILIDMEMIKGCEDCLLVDEYGECAVLPGCRQLEWGARLPDCPLREVIRCGKCRHYQGNHDVPGCAPCDFWDLAGVMWDDYCKRGERYDSD